MTADRFEFNRALYSRSHEQFGDSSAALLTPKGRHEIRFRPVLEVLNARPNSSVLDYGCGLGFLYDFLCENNLMLDYTGVDMTSSFIESCQKRIGGDAKFRVIEPSERLQESFDVVVCSGVFNLVTSDDAAESLHYVRSRLSELLRATRHALVCDFLSPFVDFQQPTAQHVSIETVTTWLVDMGFRRFQIRHDLLPYEYTIVVFINSSIARPQNVFVEDS